MKKFEIKSVFEQIANQIFTMKDVNKAKEFIVEFISSKGINDRDKKVIINNIEGIKNMMKLQMYICNSLLKYEGMSVNKAVSEQIKEPGPLRSGVYRVGVMHIYARITPAHNTMGVDIHIRGGSGQGKLRLTDTTLTTPTSRQVYTYI